ncbi:putative S-adenosylmethionine-dependent methyltransferase (plasmid) [Natrialba magadii ATCC 43099]|uniref:S-adenosylmethionine-dependent methyltransferase n=1 Tax=Natrialba magadii (strain ATCC 43099 / DSM 3394 / CCM 3739 / CIP 104546 / IAM 13178 / JCM 8861 / NBRC 102185 / NCIMB 2190 / MS3) TaxID=547559 RepID=D3T0Z0_NATMM|nr:class I SAM-dependent methyltransferase [Natrialba magadii]ADD07249.1 putative S-adenosylmethionine-dependent methyltransferase [Natrialba magadii ATCC 43099]ELY34359.1 type 11 methyltransferase [Natrialba magadii ATCC 43099]
MGFHTFPVERADKLEDPSRYRFCSREELLEMLAPDADDVVADLGSGTGFYSRDVAPFVDTVYAVDLQEEMHEYHRTEGLAPNVTLVTAGVDSLPFEDDELDGAFSTMTHHEYATDETMAELARVIRPGGRLVTVDWSGAGTGDDGPSMDERFSPDEVVGQLEDAGFSLERVHDRPETLAVVVRR